MSKIVKRIPFKHKVKQYEVVVHECENAYRIRALLNGKPVNPWVYSVDYSIVNDPQLWSILGQSASDYLIDLAKSDVIEERWEKLKSLIAPGTNTGAAY